MTKNSKPCKKCGGTERDKSRHCVSCKRTTEAQRQRTKRMAARRGQVPTYEGEGPNKGTPEGFHLRGESLLLDADGAVKLRWVKTQVDQEARLQAILDAFAEHKDQIRPVDPLPAPEVPANDDLMCVYPIGDPHLGMYAWGEETGGGNFDIEIARRELYAAADKLVSLAPPAATAVVLPLGDTFHSDDSSNRTKRSGHALDVDGRSARIAGLGIDIMGRIIDRALEKHPLVHFRSEIGNHDDESAMWLELCMAQRYRNEPRVRVSGKPGKFWYHQFGGVLIASTHGDTIKRSGPTLSETMAYDQPKLWGQTRHRYWYVGHVHNTSVHERPGVIIETFRTLAPRDAWAAAAGYRSGRDMRVDVMHRKFGRINRHIVGIEQVHADLEAVAA